MNSLTRSHSSRLLTAVATLGLAALLMPAACDSTPEFSGADSCDSDKDCSAEEVCATNGCTARCESQSDCGSEQFCTTWNACEDQCASCGSSCDVTDDCPVGQFCSSGSCQQECEPGSGDEGACQLKGLTCSEDGQCVGKTDIIIGLGGGGGQSGDGDGDNPVCIDVEVTFEPQTPNVVLLIDQSGSMHQRDGDFAAAVQTAIDNGEYTPWDCPDSPNGNSASAGWDNDSVADFDWRWNVVRNVLLHPDNGIVKPLEDKVRFGLALYSSDGGTLGGTCPMLTEVGLEFGTHEAMLDAFACSELVRDTPTRESLTATAEKLAALDVEGPKVIVLATDGAPDNCTCSDWNTGGGRGPQCDRNDSDNNVMYEGMEYNIEQYEQILVMLEAQRIHEELGITIEVINVGSSGLKGHLDNVAERGGAVSGASINGTSPGALNDAFQSIIDGVRSCAIDLDGEIASGKESTGKVLLDGEALGLDDPNGWKVNSPTQIELVGDACETIKSGDHDLDINFPCGSFVPVSVK